MDQVASSLNRTIQNQTICAAIESDSIQPIMNHFARFKDLKLDSLLALITEAKQQINWMKLNDKQTIICRVYNKIFVLNKNKP